MDRSRESLTRQELTLGRLAARLGGNPPLRPVSPEAPRGGLSLIGAELSRILLNKAQLADADLRAAKLRAADLQRADLSGACLVGADLGEARLQEADLSYADLTGANLTRAVLDGATVVGTRLAGAWGDHVSLRGVALWRSDLTPGRAARWTPALAELLRGDPAAESSDALALIAWCAQIGGEAELAALAKVVGDRRWRRYRDLAREAMGAISARVTPLTNASISLAREESGMRSLSPANRRGDDA